MKKSDALRNEAAQEENDIKAFNLMSKALREKRLEDFEEYWLDKLKQVTSVEKEEFKFVIRCGFDRLEFYPKANKVHNTRTRKWHKPGLKFLIVKFNLEKL